MGADANLFPIMQVCTAWVDEMSFTIVMTRILSKNMSDRVPDRTHWIIVSYSHEVISYIHIALRQYLCGTFVSRHDLQTILKTTPRKQATSTVTMTTRTELLYNSEGNPVKKNRALFLVSFSQVCWVTAQFYKSKMTALACGVDRVDFLNMLMYLILLNVMFCLYFSNAICSKKMYFQKEIKYICTTLWVYTVMQPYCMIDFISSVWRPSHPGRQTCRSLLQKDVRKLWWKRKGDSVS